MKNQSSLEKFLISSDDFHLVMIPYYCETIVTDNTSNKIRAMRMDALKTLSSFLSQLQNEQFDKKLICNIANKKSRMIINASSKKEINEILNPKPPRFDGNQFISSEYLTTEEELICWLKACEQAPLNYFAVKRTEELFNKIYTCTLEAHKNDLIIVTNDQQNIKQLKKSSNS